MATDDDPAALEECKLLLVGKVHSNPSFNFQAFQSVLKRAWRLDQALECCTAEMIRKAVSKVGTVLQVKSEFASGSTLKASLLLFLRTTRTLY